MNPPDDRLGRRGGPARDAATIASTCSQGFKVEISHSEDTRSWARYGADERAAEAGREAADGRALDMSTGDPDAPMSGGTAVTPPPSPPDAQGGAA